MRYKWRTLLIIISLLALAGTSALLPVMSGPAMAFTEKDIIVRDITF